MPLKPKTETLKVQPGFVSYKKTAECLFPGIAFLGVLSFASADLKRT